MLLSKNVNNDVNKDSPIDDVCGDACKWSVTLMDRLGPEILTVLEIKGQVLHRVRLHVN